MYSYNVNEHNRYTCRKLLFSARCSGMQAINSGKLVATLQDTELNRVRKVVNYCRTYILQSLFIYGLSTYESSASAFIFPLLLFKAI